MALRAIRGAIQVPANTAGDIAAGVQELIAAILKANGLTPSDVISVFFTSTVDLNAAFPAAACREMGFANVPLIGSVEVAVPGALGRRLRRRFLFFLVHATLRKKSQSEHENCLLAFCFAAFLCW